MTNGPMKEDRVSSLELLQNLSFCVVDLETTGGNHLYDKIIEIGLIKVEQLKIVDELSFLINPEIPIPEFIQKLTSIQPDHLTNCPLIENVIEKILNFMGSSILVAHNSSFDIPFFNSVLSRLNLAQLENKTLCTNLMTKNLIPDIVNSNLPYMSKIFGIHHTRAHRALEDAKATAQLLIQYLQFFIDKNIRKVNQLYYPRKKFELDSLHFKNKENINVIIEKIKTIKTPLVITIKGEKGLILDVLPIHTPQEEISFIESKIQNLPWNTISLKLTGSFIQAFFQLNQNFPKLSKNNQKEILQYLWEKHFPLEKDTLQVKQIPIKRNFIVAKHLIPEQFVIYSFPFIVPKKDLIFRYPSHYQKLQQYIERCIRRMDFKKVEKNFSNDHFWTFFYSYLKKIQDTNDPSYLIFTDTHYRNKAQQFKIELDNYSFQNREASNYPKEHI